MGLRRKPTSYVFISTKKMKISAALFALTQASEQDSGFHCWPGNEHAPYCGCQKIVRGPEFNMVNATCTLTFPDVANHPHGLALGADDLQMLTVASSFPLPDQTDLQTNTYVFTGFEGLSHMNQLDIVYFFRDDRCVDPSSYEWDRFEVNVTTWGEAEVTCVDYYQAHDGPLLGNFNYDIARSHQQYNLPIYGLDNEASGMIDINSHNVLADPDFDVELRNVSALTATARSPPTSKTTASTSSSTRSTPLTAESSNTLSSSSASQTCPQKTTSTPSHLRGLPRSCSSDF